MPPVRTVSREKAAKTHRTREENIERAYIAASRRNDRTLEARVQSAQRASEVHKQRTGRALRITPEDVMNEEMYEEEGDDLPLQYRLLTAHLQTGSDDFNRRFAAYLTHQVAVRSAMGLMSRDPYGQYPSGGRSMFPSPMLPPCGMAPSLGLYQRPAAQPSSHQANFPHNIERRADSLASAAKDQEPTSHSASAPPPVTIGCGELSTPASKQPGDKPSGQHLKAGGLETDLESTPRARPAAIAQGGPTSFPPLWQDMGPFTTSLPPESQQMLAHAPGFDINDPFYALLMRGSDQYLSNPYYPWKSAHGAFKGMSAHASAYHGMNATLAPAALESPSEDIAKDNSPNASTLTAARSSVSAESAHTQNLPNAGLDFIIAQEGREPSFVAPGESPDSGQATPAREGFWEYFVRDGSWDGGNNEAHTPTSENNSDSANVKPKVEVHD